MVTEANALSTAYLRAQNLAEPNHTRSLELLRQLTDDAIRITETVSGSHSGQTQRALWVEYEQALTAEPTGTAPRLYVDSLNAAFEAQSTQVAGLGNRVPVAVLLLELIGTAIALALLALHLGTLGRGPAIALLAALFVAATLFITFDLDQPSSRG